MPNHVHVLLHFEESSKTVTLSRVVNELKSRATVQYNRQHQSHGASTNTTNKRGTIWQYGYYDQIIRSEKQLFSVRQYIEHNPIKWGLDEYNDGPAAVTIDGHHIVI